MKNQPKGLNLKPITQAIGCALAFSSLNLYAAEAPSDAESAEDNKIIVTGSRIRADEANDTVPIEVIIADDAIDRGITSIGELLRESTLASGSAQVTAATSTAFVQEGGTGTETVGLRGLGAKRTLVLLNGRRAGPAGTRGETSSFDFNTIPLAAVERIEILKDGASSLYGSDAIAGVINIITKTTDGGTVEFFHSQPAEDGGEQTRFSASYGNSFDNGSFRVTLDHNVSSELKQGDRDYFACGELYFFDSATNRRADLIDPRTGEIQCRDLAWGHVWLYDYGGANVTGNLAQFDYDNNLGQHIDPIAAPTSIIDLTAPPGWFLVNGGSPVLNADHPFQDRQSLIPELTRTTFFATADYDFSDNVRGYAEVLFNRRETETQGYRQFWTYIYNGNFDFANGFGGGSSLSAGWGGLNWLSPTPITDHSFSNITVDYARFVAGVTADLGDWRWDNSISANRSDGDYENAVIYNDSIRDQWFSTGSCVGQTSSVRGAACVDVPWLDPQFLAGNISQEVRDYLFGTDLGNTVYKQISFESVIDGPLWDWKAGTVSGAFGIQIQRDEIDDVPGETTRNGNAWGSSSAGITAGHYDTKAIFAEVKMPLLKDLPLVEELNLSASVRHTQVDGGPDTDTFTGTFEDDDTTYKIGLAWHMGAGVTLRGSTSTSFRTPKLFELFLANQSSFIGNRAIDPCVRWGQNLSDNLISQRLADNCAADGIPADYTGGSISATVFAGGGAEYLESETAEANTWGLVWRPDFADLSISVDYFDFKIENEITQFGPGAIVSGCYNSEFFPNEPLCDLFTRDRSSTGDLRILGVLDPFINIAKQRNTGYDIDIQYKTELPSGSLTFRTQHTIQDKSEQGFFNETSRDFNGTLGEPKHTGTFLVAYDKDNWGVSWFTNMIGEADNAEILSSNFNEGGTFQGNPIRRVSRIPRMMYHTLSFNYDHQETGLSFRAGIRNLFDQEPARISSGGGTRIGNASFYSQYDWRGRTYFVNARYEF